MKNKVSLKLITLTLLLIATLPLGVQLSISELNKMENDTQAINSIGYIRGASQRVIKDHTQEDPTKIIQQIELRFTEIEQNFIKDNQDYLNVSDFYTHFRRLKGEWLNLKSILKTQTKTEDFDTFTEACWYAADKATDAMEKISKLKHKRTVWRIFFIGSFIFILLLITLYLVYTEVRTRLETKVILDPLTQLYNRSFLLEMLNQRIKTYQRLNNPFSLLFIDIDHFKQINDNYGHNKGDEILKRFANLLKQHLREDDMSFRYGGEEFVILAMYDDTAKAYALAERIRQLVHAHDFGLEYSVTISLGVCEFREGESLDGLLSHADHAMYQAKSNGRNQSVIFSKQDLSCALG